MCLLLCFWGLWELCASCALNMAQLWDPACPRLGWRSHKALARNLLVKYFIMGWTKPHPLLPSSPTKAITEIDTVLEVIGCQTYCTHETDDRGHWHSSGHFQRNKPCSRLPWILPAPWLVRLHCASEGSDFPGASGYGKFRVWCSTLPQSFSLHVQGICIACPWAEWLSSKGKFSCGWWSQSLVKPQALTHRKQMHLTYAESEWKFPNLDVSPDSRTSTFKRYTDSQMVMLLNFCSLKCKQCPFQILLPFCFSV